MLLVIYYKKMGLFSRKKVQKPVSKVNGVNIEAGTNKTQIRGTAGFISEDISTINYNPGEYKIYNVDAWGTIFYLTRENIDKINGYTDAIWLMKEKCKLTEVCSDDKEKYSTLIPQYFDEARVLYPLTEFYQIATAGVIPEEFPAKPISYSFDIASVIRKKGNGLYFIGRIKEPKDNNGRVIRVNDLGLEEAVEEYGNDFIDVVGERPFGEKNVQKDIEDTLKNNVSRKEITLYAGNDVLYAGCDTDLKNVTIFNTNLKSNFIQIPFKIDKEDNLEERPVKIANSKYDFCLVNFGKELLKLDNLVYVVESRVYGRMEKSRPIYGHDLIMLITPNPIIKDKKDIKKSYKF